MDYTKIVNAEKSHGHLGFFFDFEYFQRGTDVYRAPCSCLCDLDGWRLGARWECRVDTWHIMLEQIRFLMAMEKGKK